MKRTDAKKCAGCGHRLDKHRRYISKGRNRYGCDLVCTVDGCMSWNQCQYPAQATGEPRTPLRGRSNRSTERQKGPTRVKGLSSHG
jgi:hypothetical protein